MFTGIIEEKGSVRSIELAHGQARLVIAGPLVAHDTKEGDSIAVNGVCLTAIDPNPDGFSADVSPETLKVTTIGSLNVGSAVNLERSVTLSTRLGGHIVQGHVDSRGTFLGAEQQVDFWTVRIGFPPEFGRYLIYKGSVAVEGISLTVAALHENEFEIAVIPKTWEMTNLSEKKAGDPVNLEADLIAKYVERLLSLRPVSESPA